MVVRNRTLGSIISDYKYRYKTRKQSTAYRSEILNVVQRLEQYNEYQKQVRKEKREYERREQRKFERKIIKRIKKNAFKKYFSVRRVPNPYVHQFAADHGIILDPKLKERYESKSIYELYEFRHLTLPRTQDNVKAGQAWHALIHSWQGFKIAKAQDNSEKMSEYAKSTQKWAWCLELDYIPDFYNVEDASLKKFNERLKINVLPDRES